MKSDKPLPYQSDLGRAFEESFNPDEEYLGRDKEINKIIPLVSVYVATYQHAPFIKECLESILMQKTPFPFEILIGEDESTDGTRQICIEYAERYPEKIRLFLRDRKTSQFFDEKTGLMHRLNAKWLRKSSRGKYIAVCEGDDYWTDPLKLKKQAEFLEENEEYILTVGGYQVLDVETGDMSNEIKTVNVNDAEWNFGYSFTLEEASKVWITKSLTLMYRNKKQVNSKLYQYNYPRDVHFIYHLLQEGKGFYFTEIFGVYRLHDGGVFSSKSLREKAILRFKINRELYLVNREGHSRIMYFLAISDLLKKHKDKLESSDIEYSKSKLFLEMIKLIRTPGEFKTCLYVFRRAIK